ncbi:hypothetical protein Ga0123462_1295 [Mariprofundus ferrinatatus]|uniref:Uncharacterized protein n=1 Tax=Mariprofundus ferrinatatus TaxID=1921087 RepID=A0A2K8L7D3_9PROT|nr:hypothetical protein Ga0123462_1295 [Mariprofundus ferrinatatus]
MSEVLSGSMDGIILGTLVCGTAVAFFLFVGGVI